MKPKHKNKQKAQVVEGTIYVQSTFNNTLITITDTQGAVIAWSNAGNAGFKGTKKSTPFAAQTAMKLALEKAIARGLKSANLIVSGVGTGRDSAVRVISGTNISINSIKDKTPIPHNGPRPKKPRRV